MDSTSTAACPISGPGVDGGVDLPIELAHVVSVEDLKVGGFGFEAIFGVAAFAGLRSFHLVKNFFGHSADVSAGVLFAFAEGVENVKHLRLGAPG